VGFLLKNLSKMDLPSFGKIINFPNFGNISFCMIVKFRNLYLQKLFEGSEIPGKPKYENIVITKFKKTVLKLVIAENIKEVKLQKGLNFEGLKGDKKGFFSVRVDLKYRLIFTLEKDGKLEITEIIMIHDLSNHYK